MMKAFSFLTILESLSKKLSILRTKMHSDDLRVNHGTITRLSRVSRPFSRTSFADLFRRASFATSRRVSHFAAILTILFTVGVGNVWGEEYTLDFSTQSTTDALFSIAATLDQYKYDDNSNVAGWNLLNFETSSNIQITNKTGATITGITVSGLADNNSNKSTNIVVSDGTNSINTGSSSWNNRKNSTSLTTKSFDPNNVAKLKMTAGTTYTITTSYNVGIKITITYTPSSSGGGETPDPDPDQPGTGGDGDSDGCTKIFWFANDADATAAGVENNTTTFSGVNSGSNSALGSITIDGKSYSVTKRGSTNSTSITFSVPANKVGTLYGLAITSSSSGAARTLTLTNTASYSKTQSTSTSQSDAGEFTFTDMPAGSYTLAWSGNGAECMLCLKLCDAAPSCTAPTNVAISGAWDKFGGETISLSATPTGGTGDYSYQWQKYYDSNWNNITDNATATTANLVYENCDGSHSGTYRCVVSTGTDCSTASDGLQVKVYTLECYTNGTNIYHFTRNGNTQSGTLTLNLNANTAYKFKVHVDNDYYGNGGTINKDETNWVLGAELGTPDLTVNSGLGGTFTFTIDYSESGNSNTLGVPEISVTYPRKTIYLNPGVWIADGAKYAIYYFIDGHDAWSNLLVGDACGTYTTIPQWNGVTMIAVRLSNDATVGTWDKKWNQTGNIPVNNNDYIAITGWGDGDSPYTYTTYTPTTYSITFNGNGNTGGSMTNVTGITCGGSAKLTQNAFTRTGYTFAGWATAANGTGTSYADKATISNITSNITLYAKWNAITYNITFDKENGTGGTTQVTATYNSSTIASVTNPTRECYTFDGWYSGDNGTGSLVINTTGVLQANVSGYTGTNGVWIATENKTLYAKWTKNATTLLLQRTGSEATPAGGVAVGGNAGTLNCIAEQGTIASYQWKQNTRGSKDGAVNAVGEGATTANFSPKPTAAGSYWYYCVATDECGNEVETTLSGCFLFKALYTVTFNPNNGSVDPTSATQSESGAAIILPTPTRSGYMFTGWYTAASGGTKIGDANASYTPTANITLYAQWEHVLVFNLPNDFNGTTQEWAVSSDNSANKLQNYAYILVEVPEATSEGSVSWKGTGADANRTLYMYSDGTLDNSKSFTYSTSYVSQTFGSTNIITIGGKYYLKFSTTADWKAANVRIDLTTPCTAPTNAVINGGGTYNSGSNITLTVTANNITNGTTTYTWYRSNSGQEAAITAGPIQEASTNNTYVINSCVQSDAQVYYCLISNGDGCNVVASTSIAINVVTTYTLTYDANAGTDVVANMPAPEQHTPGTYTLSDLVPTRTGYTFAGWNRNPEGTGDNFNAAAQFTTGALNETLYAKWTPETYNILYYEAVGEVNDINGLKEISIDGAPTSYTILDAVELPALPAKDGYTATGWYSQWCVFENQENTQYWAGCTPTTGHNAGYYGHANYIVKYTLNTPVTPDPGTLTALQCGTLYKVENMVPSGVTLSETGQYAAGISENTKFEVIGDAAETSNASGTPEMKTGNAVTLDSKSFEAHMWMKGAANLTDSIPTSRAIKFILSQKGTLTIYYRDNNNGAGQLKLIEENSPSTAKWTSQTKGDAFGTSELEAGTYYIYATAGSTAIYGIQLNCVTCTTPTITFNNGSYTVGGSALDLSTLFTSNSAGAVTYTVTNANGTGATIDGTSFTATAAGTATVTATQAANGSHCEKAVTATITAAAASVDPDPEPGDCVTIFEAKATSKTAFSATTGTITSSNLSEGDELNKDGYSYAVKPNSSNALKIAPKAGETFKVGDKLTFVVYTAKDKEIGFVIGGNTYTQSVNKSLYYFEQELKETDITDGATSITFNRNSGDARWVEVKIERCAQLPSCTTPVLSNLENQKVCPGSDVTWTASNTATLQGGETIAYQWNKKGNNTVLSNSATLTLDNVTEAAGGTYVVTATVSANGKASATATKEVTLTVTPATATPAITASASTVYTDNDVTLTASCASSGVTYQWYTCTDAEGNGESAIGNAKNAEYTPSTATAGTYYYKVIVTGDGTNSCGTAEKVYELAVKTPSAGCYDMIIFDSSEDQTIPAENATGTEANTGASWANVGTSKSSGSCTYTYNGKTYNKGWKFVGGTTKADSRYIQFEIPSGYVGSLFMAGYITSTDRSVFISDNPIGSLVTKYAYIKPSAANVLGTASVDLPTGTYYVCATDAFLLTELSIEICSDVNCTDPQVTATVNNATICAGAESTVTFTATNYADGAAFQWQKKDGNTWENISGATSATYTIPSVTTAHAGQYRVIAEKGCKRMSEEIKLTVLTAPTFNTFATTASVMKGNALAISDVQATGATGYAWYKSSDNSLDAAEDTKVGTSKDLLLAAASIPEAADQTFYLFCVASNSCGSVTSNAITVTVTPFVEEECATKGNEGDHEFGFTNTGCGDDTYGDSKTPVWKTNSRKKYLTYTAPEGRYFATAKVTVAHTGGTKCGYAYSTDGGATWVVKELDGLSTTLTAITIELSELSENVNAFRISRNLTAQDGEKGSDSETFYLAEACFTYKNACTETTLIVGSYYNEYNISTQMDFVEPTFTLKSGETTLEGQTLTYTSSNTAIATVDEDGNVTFEGMTGTVTITATFAGGEISETEYCACQGSYTITVGCKDQAPMIVAAAGTKLDGCNNSITLEAKMQDGTTAFADGTFQWYRDGVAIDGATSASYTVVRAGTYTVSRTYTCATMSSNSAVVTNENVEPEVERLTPFQYYHVDKTYSNQMKGRHLFAVTSYGTLDGKRYHLTATRNGETLDLSSSTAFFTIPSSDNAVDTVMIDLNKLKGKYSANDEIVITCAPINSCNNASAITSSITIHVIDQTPTLALICSGADGEGTRETANLVVGGDFLTGYNKADLCQQTGGKTFDANTEWGFYTELKEKYIVTPVNGYAEFNKLNYEPFDILLLTDYPKASKSEAAATILDDMAALCDYRPLLSLKAHMVAKSPSKWAAKGFTTSPVVPAATSQYANIVCYAHPMFDELDDAHVEGIYHDHDDFNQLVYKILTGPGHEGSKGLQGFELKDADNFVTIGLIHYNAAAAVVEHDNHTHLEWTPAADDRQLVAIAERQANIEARMILFAINCGAQSMQTPMGRQVLLTCLDYLLKTDLIEVADCRLTFDNGEGNADFDPNNYEGTGTIGDGLWSTAANWGPEYTVIPGRNNDVRIAAPCTVDANEVEVLSVHITENGSLTIPADKSFTARSTILRADENGNVYPTNVEDISLGSNAGGNASLILNNERGDTKAGVAMYSTAKADTENYSAAESTWQYIGTPHSDVQNAAKNYYDSWLYQYDTGTQGWAVIPNGGPLVPFRGYCVTHPENPHTYWMEGTLVSTTNQDISIPANTFVVVANSWTAPIQIGSLEDDDMEGLTDKTIYFFNTGSDPNQAGELNQGRYAAGTYVSVPIHSAPYTGDSYIPSMQGFYVVGGGADGTLHLDYERHVRAPRTNTPSGPMHAPARRVAADNEPQVAKFLFRGTRYDDRLIILERPDFTRGYDSGWDGEQWGGNAAAPMSYVVTETRWDAVSAIPEYEGTVIAFRAGEDSEYTIHFDYDGMEDALYLLDTDTQIYTRVLKGNSYTFTCTDKAEHNRFILTRKAPQIATGTDHINTGENAKAVKFIKDDKIFIFVNGMLYDATGKMVIR